MLAAPADGRQTHVRFWRHLALAFSLAWPRLTAQGRGAAARLAILYLLFACFLLIALCWGTSLIWEAHIWRDPIKLTMRDNILILDFQTSPGPPMSVKFWYQYNPGEFRFPPLFYSMSQFAIVIVIPFWIPLAGSGVITLLVFWLVVRRPRLHDRCDHCAYPLMGTLNPRGGGRCPECGRRQRENGGVRTLLRILWRLMRRMTRRAIEIGKALVAYDAPFPNDPPRS